MTNDFSLNYFQKKYQIQANKKFSQNFLFDQQLLSQIVEQANVQNKQVVEIGPGLGALTRVLLKYAATVTSYEVDPTMIKILKQEITAHNFVLKAEDFLAANFFTPEKQIIVANIPYHITSKILFKIFHHLKFFKSAILMVQKEVGLRLLARANNSNYGKLSVTSQILAQVTKVCDVPKTKFWPIPKVDSMVVKLTFTKEVYDQDFFDFVKKCFAFQRKTLVNNLKKFLDEKQIFATFASLNLPKNIRPQQLEPNQFIKIYKNIYNITCNDE